MSDERKVAAILPLPEMIDGRDWEVRDSGDEKLAYVDFSKNEMVVPTGASELEEFVRAHEAMHVKITPRNASVLVPEDLENSMLQAAEDARVQTGLRMTGIPMPQTFTQEEIVGLAINPQVSEMEAAGFLLAYTKTGDERLLREVIGGRFPRVPEIVDAIHEKHFGSYEKQRKLPPFQETIDAATALYEAIEAKPPPPSPQGATGGEQGKPSDSPEGGSQGGTEGNEGETTEQQGEGETDSPEGSGKGKGSDDPARSDSDTSPESGSPPETKKEERRAKDLQKPVRPQDAGAQAGARVDSYELPPLTKQEEEAIKSAGIKKPKKFDPKDGVKSAEMKIERPPLTQPFKTRKNLQKRPSDYGAVPRNLHRYSTDQRIFQSKQWKFGGAAVLIDVSQSMFMAEDDVDFILQECPSAIVAIYSGPGELEGQKDGILRVIAEHKSKIDPKSLRKGRGIGDNDYASGMGVGNAVDIPALEWLAQRKEPRKIWISDGVITGKRDLPLTAREMRKAADLIHRHRIIRVNHLSDLKKASLLRYQIGDNVSFEAPEQWVPFTGMGTGAVDLNGPGCPACSDPNCSWWASSKRDLLRKVADGWVKVSPSRNEAMGK